MDGYFGYTPEQSMNMNIQTLVVTTNQNDESLPKRMNIRTDAVVGNQCGRDEIYEFEYNGHRIQYVNSSLRGVGINRNHVLMRASGDICVLADDDMIFLPGYEDTVRNWFNKLPDADILIFNLEGGKKRYKNKRITRITPLNYGKFGTARLAFRTRSVRFSGLMFHTMFGGGCEFSCGEDTLFLHNCLKNGLRIYGVPDSIAQISDDTSSWFNGYTDKFFFDKGVVYYALDHRLSEIHAWIHCLRHRKKYSEYGWINGAKQMIRGIRSVK